MQLNGLYQDKDECDCDRCPCCGKRKPNRYRADWVWPTLQLSPYWSIYPMTGTMTVGDNTNTSINVK